MFQLPECAYCDSTHGLQKVGEDLVCEECRNKGVKKPEPVSQPPININEVLTKSREVDNRVQVRTDLFNAATVAIVELKKAIDSDESITNKPFALATELHTRYNHFKSVIFELNEKVVEATNQQKAIQVYLNQLANSLRAEEREKLKLQDINYKPRTVKMPVTQKTIRLSKKRLDKKELRARAAELGIPEFSLQMICIQKHMTVEEAYKLMKANIEAAKAQATPTE